MTFQVPPGIRKEMERRGESGKNAQVLSAVLLKTAIDTSTALNVGTASTMVAGMSTAASLSASTFILTDSQEAVEIGVRRMVQDVARMTALDMNKIIGDPLAKTMGVQLSEQNTDIGGFLFAAEIKEFAETIERIEPVLASMGDAEAIRVLNKTRDLLIKNPIQDMVAEAEAKLS